MFLNLSLTRPQMARLSEVNLKNEKAPTKAILGTRQLKPGYGLPINPSHVISSLSRPVYEPPALEVLDMFESKEWEDEIEAWEKSIPDVEVRTRYVDLMMELATGVRYGEWVVSTGKEAIEKMDREREAFYEKLLESLKVEVRHILEDVARMEAEELPNAYAVAQKVIMLEEDLFTLRPKLDTTGDDAAQSDDEMISESLHGDCINEEEAKTNGLNLIKSVHRSGLTASGADAGYRSTVEDVLLLPKFSIKAFIESLGKQLKPAQHILENDID